MWRAESAKPLSFILLLPLRLLPQAMLPLALNLVSAFGGALVLVLLARSVMLLRYDLPAAKPPRKEPSPNLLPTPSAWIPPVFAVVLCAFELTFWERSTSLTAELFDLLAFAYALRCLLEFRLTRKDRWLFRSIFVFGLGMADDWLFVWYFPAFILAVLLLKSLGAFLKPRFLARLALWLLAGLSMFLLLPLLSAFFSNAQHNFWTALSAEFQAHRAGLAILRNGGPRIVAVVSFLPVLLLVIPWKSHTVQSSDDSRMGVWLTRATGHFVHALCLVAIIWWALDPAFSPRHVIRGGSILPMYFLSALAGGYCAGYFLLFGWPDAKSRRPAARLAFVCVWALLVLTPAFLLAKNLALIRIANGPTLRAFARQLYNELPAGKSVVLSDEWNLLVLLRAELAAHGGEKTPLLLEARAVSSPAYQRLMAKTYPNRWPVTTNSPGSASIRAMQSLIDTFAAHEMVVYLHPSSGLFFENYCSQPLGSVQRLVPRDPGITNRCRLDESVLAANERLWQQRWSGHLQTVASQTRTDSSTPSRNPVIQWLHLPAETSPAAKLVAAHSSKSLNSWGVQMQRNGHWTEARAWFQRAIELNPKNLSAKINADFNQRHSRGENQRLDFAKLQSLYPELSSRQTDLAQVLNDGGVLDDPTMVFQVARVLERSGNPRQALNEITRCYELAPEWPAPTLWLARDFVAAEQFDPALRLCDTIPVQKLGGNGAGLAELLHCRVSALRGLGRTNDASAYLESFAAAHPEQIPVLSTAASLCANARQMDRELFFLEQATQLAPKNTQLLVRKGIAELQLSRFEAAVESLTRAVNLEPADSQARLQRATAYLGAGQLDAARTDYTELLKEPRETQNALFGLAAIAWRKNETNAAIQCYGQYLSNATPGTAQYSIAAQRLKLLKSGQ